MTVTPQRIQLSRKKGFNLQAVSLALNGLPAVNVARPSKWGNPFKIGVRHIFGGVHDRESVNRAHKVFCSNKDVQESARRDLRGNNVACWCPVGAECHADNLLRIANERK
jgi:hypothetical protein